MEALPAPIQNGNVTIAQRHPITVRPWFRDNIFRGLLSHQNTLFADEKPNSPVLLPGDQKDTPHPS
jgi:hypothetical protein